MISVSIMWVGVAIVVTWFLVRQPNPGSGPIKTRQSSAVPAAPPDPEPSQLVAQVKRHRAAKAALIADETTIKELMQ